MAWEAFVSVDLNVDGRAYAGWDGSDPTAGGRRAAHRQSSSIRREIAQRADLGVLSLEGHQGSYGASKVGGGGPSGLPFLDRLIRAIREGVG